jgi:hypothetical protein
MVEGQFKGVGPAIAQEIELGQHLLLVYEDSSLDLADVEQYESSLVANVVQLDPDETYKLLISLQVWFEKERKHC